MQREREPAGISEWCENTSAGWRSCGPGEPDEPDELPVEHRHLRWLRPNDDVEEDATVEQPQQPRRERLDAYGRLTKGKDAQALKQRLHDAARAPRGCQKGAASLVLPSGVTLPLNSENKPRQAGYLSTNARFDSNASLIQVSRDAQVQVGQVTRTQIPVGHYRKLRDYGDNSLLHHAQDEYRNVPMREQAWAEEDAASLAQMQETNAKQKAYLSSMRHRSGGGASVQQVGAMPRTAGEPRAQVEVDARRDTRPGPYPARPARERSAWGGGRSGSVRLMGQYAELKDPDAGWKMRGPAA